MSALAVPVAKSEPTGATRPALPSRARVVVVGAGVIGCSVAYYLTRLGCRDVLLLERKSVGCGTTWHSHGVVGLVRASQTLLRMTLETARMIPELERETGRSTGYSVRGSVNVASDPSRMIQFRRFADIAQTEGLPVEIIDAAEAKRLWPHLNTEGLIGAMHLPTEGQCNPMDLTQALVAGARAGGARVTEGVAVTGVNITSGRIATVDTDAGPIECEYLVNCTGLWGRDFLRTETGGLPLQAVEHNYLVTEFSEDINKGLPLLRDPDAVMTIREDSQQLSFGFNEHEAKLFAQNGVPETFEFDQLPPDWDAVRDYVEDAARRVPLLNELGIRLFLCGPEAATPDTRYLLGPVTSFPNYFVAAGFTGIGIGSAGGAGLAIARWVLEGAPGDDLWEVDVQRMMPYQANRNYLMRRTVESNGKLFAMNWPHRQNRSARGVRRSPLHDTMTRARACFFEVSGWEVPEWFAPDGVEPIPHYSFEQPAWFPYARVEAQAALGGVALADRSMIGKFLVVGAGAEAALAGLCANDPARSAEGPILTPVLNSGGGIEALFTLIRRGDNSFLLLGEAATQARDLAFLREQLASKRAVSVVDMTSAFSVINVIGPSATDALTAAGWRGGQISEYDDEAEIGFGNAVLFAEKRLPVPAWSVLVPSEFAVGMFEALMDAGEQKGARPIGYHAYQSLLTSAGSPVWSQGLSARRSPVEAGLETLVDLSGERDFPGRDVCARQMAEGVTHRLATLFLCDDEAVLLGHEPISIDGVPAGTVDQAAYALACDRAIGFAYLSNGGIIKPGTRFAGQCEIALNGRKLSARYNGLGEAGADTSDLPRQSC